MDGEELQPGGREVLIPVVAEIDRALREVDLRRSGLLKLRADALKLLGKASGESVRIAANEPVERPPPREQVLEVFRADPERTLTVEETLAAVEEKFGSGLAQHPLSATRTHVLRLYEAGRLERVSRGIYRLART